MSVFVSKTSGGSGLNDWGFKEFVMQCLTKFCQVGRGGSKTDVYGGHTVSPRNCVVMYFSFSHFDHPGEAVKI